MAAEVNDKPQENTQDAGDNRAADAGVERDNREFMTVQEAQAQQERDRNPNTQIEAATKEAKAGACDSCHKDVGDGEAIAKNAAVKESVDKNKSKDPSAEVKGDKLSFSNKELFGSPLDGLAGKNNNNGEKLALAGSVKVGDQKFDAASGKAAEKGQPGDNNVREIDPSKDNPEAVKERYDQMVDGLGLSPSETARMKEQFDQDMSKIQEKFKGDDLNHVMRSMNLMMDRNNHLGNDTNRVNAVAGLAARGAEPQEANRQGANPTCALTSQSRVEQQRDFVKYADQMGSVAAKGGAWRGGENGNPPVWVDVNAAGTNGANFKADGEASRMYNKDYHQAGGHRDYLGQLDNAVVGGEMAKYAGQQDGKDYVYVAANAQKVPGSDSFGQGASGNTLMVRDSNGKLSQARDGGEAVNCPPSTLDMVAKVNHANGGGGLFVQENLAKEYRQPDGSYPPGMNVFKDAADLRQQLAANPGKEYQIATNGVIVAGRQGHGLHAQTVQLNDKGQLEFGNNWGDKDNHRVYSDDFVNKFTDKSQWNSYTPQHVTPDGQPDWRRERVGPNTDNSIGRDSQDMQKQRSDEKDKKDKDEQDKKNEEQKKKDEKEADEKQKDVDKQKAQQKAEAQFKAEHEQWQARKEAFMAKNPEGTFSESEPVFKAMD